MGWRILIDGSRNDCPALPGAENMAIDEAILAGVEKGISPPTIRVYGWSPACLTVGNSQDPQIEFDLAAVRAAGIDVVKRPTGGRAVLHIRELTYSVIAPQDAEPWCRTQSDSYRTISTALVTALSESRCLSESPLTRLEISLDRGYPVERPLSLRAMTPCFSSTARSEVVFRDRKLVGSAQRRLRGSFLQHGSILINRQHRRIVEFLRLEAGKRARYLEILDRNAISLEEVCGRSLAWEELAEGFAGRLARALGVAAEPMPLSDSELEPAHA